MPVKAQIKISKTSSMQVLKRAARLMAASDPWRKLGRGYRACLNSMTAPFREVYIARSEREIAGLAIITMYGTFRGYIQSLFVAETFRDRGLGAQMMEHAEEKIFSRAPNVFLCVSSFNKKAIRFYKRLGYRQCGRLADFIVRGHDELLMRKTIAPVNVFYRRPSDGHRP
ncbi:MAG: GNAT family N-acetyltransferase [Elusimicrobia bacterium]|nr:GNAT family N-acetyltransferase [Elusimicrobiota bacterium]